MTGEPDARAVPDQDPRLHEPGAQRRRAVDGDEQEVRGRARERSRALQRVAEKGPLLDDEAARPLQVLLVLQRGQCRDLGEPVHVVGGAHAVEAIDRRGARHGVAHAESGEAGDLRERAEHDQAGIAREQGDAVGRVGVVAEVVIRLVQHDEGRVRSERLEKGDQGGRRMMVVAGLCGVQSITAFVRSVTLRRTSSRSVSYRASGLGTTRAPASVAPIVYGSKDGSGTITSSPGSNAAAAMSAISSSAPLPMTIWSAPTPSRCASASRRAVEPPSG